jgi:hypothetical protein
MLGSWYSGEFWNLLGPGLVYSIASAASLLAWVIVWIWVERAKG